MALNVTRAKNAMTDTDIYLDAVMVIAGSLVSSLATDAIRSNVIDLQMKGADAVYSFVAAFVLLAVLPRKYEPVALGATASGARIVAEEFGVLDVLN